MTMLRTLYKKIWSTHVIDQRTDGSCLLHVDRHIINEGTSVQAFESLRQRGIPVLRPDMHVAVADHVVPTINRAAPLPPGRHRDVIELLERNCAEAGIAHIPFRSDRQGICHVIAPEQGFVLPGMIAVCGDSHTATLGALGVLGFGIGTSELEHVLATGAIVQSPSRTMAIEVDGTLGAGVTAKDIILAIIGHIGSAGGTGFAIEYRGTAIRAMGLEARMSLCNMSIEGGAKVGLIAPDETTFAWLAGRDMAPVGADWDAALGYWRTLVTDEGASFDRTVRLHADDIAPQVTWGTSLEHVSPVDGSVPDPVTLGDTARIEAARRALAYQGLVPGTRIADIRIDRVFIGSCTNSRLPDLRDAADVVRGRHLADGVSGFVVPGSMRVKQEAEAEGLDRVFIDAGFEWRDSGCSMCGGGDPAPPGTRVASTSNRNFEHRQGRDVHTHIVGPAMAAAAGIAGHFVDVRDVKRVPA